MLMRGSAAVLAVGLTVSLGAVTALAGPIGYTLGGDGTALLSFDVSAPGAATSVFFSGDGSRLDGIDFRPATGELFGYDDVADQYYTVDPMTGVLTNVSGTVAPTNTLNLDIDWNPTIDRMRTVTETDQNIVFNPNTGDASDAATTPLFYGPGDANEGADPSVTANAYNNSFAGSVSTTQFVLDYGLDVLATLANNAGTLSTVADVTLSGSPLDFDAGAGLDILSIGGGNVAYAVLNVSGVAGLYTIDLTTGEADFIGDFSNTGFGGISGLAVIAVPEPGTMALFAAGGAVLLLRRRRRG